MVVILILICLEQEPIKVIFILFKGILPRDSGLIIHINDCGLSVLHASIRCDRLIHVALGHRVLVVKSDCLYVDLVLIFVSDNILSALKKRRTLVLCSKHLCGWHCQRLFRSLNTSYVFVFDLSFDHFFNVFICGQKVRLFVFVRLSKRIISFRNKRFLWSTII